MKYRFVDFLLLLIIIPGAFLAWFSGQEHSRLRTEYQRLVQIVGDLEISDHTKLHIRALPTGDKLHFAWRCYLPGNYALTVGTGGGSWSRSQSGDPREFIARVRIREDERGDLQIHTHFFGGSSRMSLDKPQLAEMLRDRADTLQVEQLGSDRVVQLAPDQRAQLLQLTLPPEMQAELQKKLSPTATNRVDPVIFQLHVGREAKMP